MEAMPRVEGTTGEPRIAPAETQVLEGLLLERIKATSDLGDIDNALRWVGKLALLRSMSGPKTRDSIPACKVILEMKTIPAIKPGNGMLNLVNKVRKLPSQQQVG